MLRHLFGPHTTTVADIAAAIGPAIGIQQFLPVARMRCPDPVLVARDGGKIAHDQDAIRGILGAPQKRHHTLRLCRKV